ncbi:MAG: tetratricopeptide repeat protein [Candidatus Methylomirabilia bacterium]
MADSIPRSGGGGAAEHSETTSAISRYQERLAKDPASLAFAPLAEAFRKAGRTREAIALCMDGLRRYPDYTTARVILAKAYLAEGNQEAALRELDTVVTQTPDDALSLRLLADLYARRGELKQAVAALERVVRLDPTDREAQSTLDLLTERGGRSESSPIFRLLGDGTFATATFASLCLEQGLHDEAATIFLGILKQDPGNGPAREGLAAALSTRTARRGRV